MEMMQNKTRRMITLAGVLTLMLAVVGMAAAQGPGLGRGQRGPGNMGPRNMGPGDGPEARLEMLAERLELTDEQMEAIQAIHESARKDGMELRKEVMRLRNDLKGEMLEDNPSEKTVLALNQKIGDLKTDLKAIRLKTRLAVRNELTADQRDRMLLMKKGRKFQGQRRHEGRHGGFRGPGCRLGGSGAPGDVDGAGQ